MNKDLLLAERSRTVVFRQLYDQLEKQIAAETDVMSSAYSELLTQFIDQQVNELLGKPDRSQVTRNTIVAHAVEKIDNQEKKIAELEARRETLDQLQTTPGDLINALNLFAQGL